MSGEALKLELATYDQHKDELVGRAEGKFVLIHEAEIAGIWDTYADALQAGYAKYGLAPFLVKQIQGIEQIQFFTRSLGACPS